jgi:hypothetical protein
MMGMKLRICFASAPELMPKCFGNPGSDGATDDEPWSQAKDLEFSIGLHQDPE